MVSEHSRLAYRQLVGRNGAKNVPVRVHILPGRILPVVYRVRGRERHRVWSSGGVVVAGALLASVVTHRVRCLARVEVHCVGGIVPLGGRRGRICLGGLILATTELETVQNHH